jgi:transposase
MERSTTLSCAVTYAGIDYHKKFSVVSLGDATGNLIRQEKIYNDEREVRKFFGQFGKLKCAVESCRGYEWFTDLLEELGMEVFLCHPRKVKLIAESRNKTDKVDSKILMQLLANNFLPTVYRATRDERELREKLRWRVHLVRNAVRIKLRIHALLDKENKGHSNVNLFTGVGREYLRTVKLRPQRRKLVDQQLEILEFLEEKISQELKWIKSQVKKRKEAIILKTVPGFGDISALMFIAEIGNITRFARAEQIPRYFGLTPSENSSGERRRLGPITKEGSSVMRWLLIQDAWQAIRSNHVFQNKFEAISRRRGRNVAIVAIARKLSECAYHVLKTKQPFDSNRLATGSARPRRESIEAVP